MAISDQDREAISRVARLLIGNHFGAESKAKIIEIQIIEIASHHSHAGAGSVTFWIATMGTFIKQLQAFIDEQKEIRRQLKLD